MRRLAPLLLVLVAVAGCGDGSKSASSEVTATVRRYFAALAAGNGPEACSLLSEKEMLHLKEKHVSCPHAVAVAHSLARDAFERLRTVTLSSPVVFGNGDLAIVRAFPVGGEPRKIALSRSASGWRIEVIDVFKAQPVLSVNRRGLEAELSAREVVAARINKRIRAVHVTLRDGAHELATYEQHEEPGVAEALQKHGVPVTIMSPPEAERDAAALRETG